MMGKQRATLAAVAVFVGVAGLAGCASVKDIVQSPATLDVISGKSPEQYAACLVKALAPSREPATLEKRGDGYRVIVPQKLSSDPAAVVIITERSNGSAIKVHERLSNLPVRSGDVREAAEHCISG